jgi:hypothetical protein
MIARLVILLGLALALLSGTAATAHEIRPGLLQLREVEAGQFEYLWRMPVRDGRPLEIDATPPSDCRFIRPPTLGVIGGYAEKRGALDCESGLRETVIEIKGLTTQRTDALVRVEFLNGGSETLRATPEAPAVTITGPRSLWRVSAAYLGLGIEHILLGIDHLMFVAALLMLVDGWRRLVATLTAFTLAHSITLVGATLGFLSAPSGLIEALIALSIVFVAGEVVHRSRGVTTLAIRKPWLIAFAFGLLHGFGFAGALKDVGLPADAVPAALLFFNVGVEAGQLAFIGAVMLGANLLGRLRPVRSGFSPTFVATAIGILAAFWTVERVASIWA